MVKFMDDIMYKKQKFLLLHDLKDSNLYQDLKNNEVIIAGGAIRSVFGNEKISDYDIYFRSNEALKNLEEKLLEKEFIQRYRSDSAISYSKARIKIQLICLSELICETPKEIIDQFDYTVCMGAFDTKEDAFVLHPRFIEHIARKELVFNINAKYPIASMYRLNKYIAKGYHISGTEMVKLALSINNLNMRDYHELKKQLMGVDTLFLQQLTDKLMSPDYADKEYDFNEFIEMLDDYYGEYLENIMEMNEEKSEDEEW